MSLSGGMMAGYIFSKGDAFWTYSAGLCGVIAASAGNDLYHPIQAMLIGAIVPFIAYKLHYWVERRFKIDDAVGAVAVHGYGGFLGVVIAGFMLWGQPSSPYEGYAVDHPAGATSSAPASCSCWASSRPTSWRRCSMHSGLLRVPRKVNLKASISQRAGSLRCRSGRCHRCRTCHGQVRRTEHVNEWNDKLGR